jgi:hydrogenase maturation protease
MRRVLVIGFGNELRGDDGLGPVAAQHLQLIFSDGGVDFLIEHQLYPEMAEIISHFEHVIFIDADIGENPGQISHSVLSPQLPSNNSSALSHDVNPAQLMLMSQQLYAGQATAEVYSVSAASFEFSEGLSAQIESVLPALIEQIAASIRQHISD